MKLKFKKKIVPLRPIVDISEKRKCNTIIQE